MAEKNPKQITLGEVRKLKAEAELEISKIIRAFTSATYLIVDRVEASTKVFQSDEPSWQNVPPPAVCNIELTIKL